MSSSLSQPATGPVTPDTHRCPGCRAPGVPNHKFACRNCWFRLPVKLRRPITAAYNLGDGEAHAAAMKAAVAWFRANPRPAGAP